MTRREEILAKLYVALSDAEMDRADALDDIKLAERRVIRANRIMDRARKQIAELIGDELTCRVAISGP